LNTFYYILLGYCTVVIIFSAYAFLTVEPYPQELQKQEDKELKIKFKEHKKAWN
jgi:hypothetical protein